MKQALNASPPHRRPRHCPPEPRPQPGPPREADPVQLLHELQCHQIELEAQNAELRRARQESEAALERFTKFYDCAPVGYFTLGQDGSILRLNPAGACLLGGERRRLVKKRFGLFVEPADRPAFNDFLAGVFAGGGKERCDVALRDPDSLLPPTYVHLEAVQRESGLSCKVVAVDVSERRRAELLREKYREDLEATVAERTAELSAANQELEGFVYAASHDMKAPLARLGSLSALLSHKLRARMVDAEEVMVLDLIRQNAQRLSTLVEDLLAHAQIRQQPLNVQPVDVAALAQAVLREQAEDIRQKGADVWLDLPADLTVHADPLSLRQVLHNLIENALKYSAQAMPPVIEIGGRIEGGASRLWVRDNGIGINPRYHDRIFEIFRRLHTYSEYPGTGVGLALVKKAIERMGGQVWVESEPGQGATFHVAWPVSLPGR